MVAAAKPKISAPTSVSERYAAALVVANKNGAAITSAPNAAEAQRARLHAEKLLATPARKLGWKDRLRLGIVFAPPLSLGYWLVCKRLVLDGWPGLAYSLRRVYAELVLSMTLLDRRLLDKQRKEGR